ncbi:hypothetical protein Trydic_g18253 [Trypoxylus dichotomus]
MDKQIQWSEDRKKVVFTDEKRFSLNRPDGFQHYWDDLRKEPKVMSRRPQGGGGVMGSLNAQKYLEIIEKNKRRTPESNGHGRLCFAR